jgi:lactate dehydrogenase-like 2-hydroxyacid dehydrogenase
VNFMLKIVVLDAATLGDDVDLSVFKKFGEVEIFQKTKPHETLERIREKDIVIVNKVLLKKELLEKVDSLKLICLTATGTNNVDLDYAKDRKIGVANVAGYSTMSVAQHTFALLFYLYEKLNYFDSYVKSGEYCASEQFAHHGRTFRELDQKTWGIIGLGTIGKKVANIANSFGCKIVYYSTSGKNVHDEYKSVSKEELLRNSDIISIHAPLNDKTKNLIAYEDLSIMKKDAILLNLGRGTIVHEGDLARALNEGKIAGAGLDVLEYEPMAEDCPLRHVQDSEKLLITPHIAWASIEARERLVKELMENIEAFLAGKERNRVC